MGSEVTKVENEGEVVERGEYLPANPMELLSSAVRQGVSTENLRELMQLEREYRADKGKAEYAQAMTKFAGLKKNIKHNRKGKTAGNASFSYADYPGLVNTISPWLADCGLSFSHREGDPVFNQDGKITCIMVYCTIKHVGGHSEEFQYPAIPDTRLDGKVSPSQLIQLAITYAKRQTVAMGFGLATAEDVNDDDSQVVDVINDEQLAKLKALLKKTNRTEEKTCEWLKVDTLGDLTVDAYEKACVTLKQFVKDEK